MELIYSVKEVFANYLKGAEKFVIPAYQRGNKWKIKDIEQLLNDINAFQTHEDDEVFYCLQNITLVKTGNIFNVIDGQQRLTTLSLILAYLGKSGLVSGKLEYKIRKETEVFLNDYVYQQKLNVFCNNLNSNGTLLEWDNLGVTDVFNYQDIFYLYNAYRTIQLWFETNKNIKEMEDKILHRVKLIVNRPQINSTQEFELFDNLNGKRVSLDGADLIRAMIITRVARKEVEDIDESSKHDVLLNENRVKNGLKLDDINNWWRIPERQNYFDVFIRNINSKGENIIFDEKKYPIDILYKLFIQTSFAQNSLAIGSNEYTDFQKGSGTIKLQYFENSDNLQEVFSKLQDVQRLIEYWYEDATLYHLVRYSAIYLKKTFNDLTDLWMSNNKNSFIAQLKNEIRANEFIDLALQTEDENGNKLTDDQLNFNENWYDGDNTDMMPLMVLLDIIRILSSKTSKFPIANLDPSHFVAVKEDKEHIFPQTPLDKGYSIDTLNYYNDIVSYCGHSKLYARILHLINNYPQQILTNESFRKWFNNKLTSEIVPINSIGNVCLLQDSVNRSYGNDFFAKKHFDIMQKSSNGEYIRPHVLDAFAKIMATSNQRANYTYMQKWTKDDIFARRKYIVEQINDFLK